MAQTLPPLPDPVATFSILGFDPATGEIGGAVQSRVFSVGNGVLWAEAGVGVVGHAGHRRRQLRAEGAGAAARRDGARGDHQGDLGQRSRSAARATGPSRDVSSPSSTPKATRRSSPGRKRRRGPDTSRASSPRRRATSSPASRSSPTWSRRSKRRRVISSMRLMAALDAGQAAGGDTRGMQSASMLIVGKGNGRVAEQRRRPAPAGGRQPRAAEGNAPPGRRLESAPREKGQQRPVGAESRLRTSTRATDPAVFD